MPLQILIVVALFAVPLAPTFWAILDIPKRQFESSQKKMIWFFAVSTLPLIGAVFYILIGRRRTQALLVQGIKKDGP
jgi:hypothetical protein